MLAVVGAGLGLLVAQAGIRVLRTVTAASLPAGTDVHARARVLPVCDRRRDGPTRSVLARSSARRDPQARHRAAAPRRPGFTSRVSRGTAPRPRRGATGRLGRPTRRRRAVPADPASALGAGSWLFDRSCVTFRPSFTRPTLECRTGRVLGVAVRAAARASRRRIGRRRKRSDERSEHRHRTPDRRPRGRRRPSARRAIHAGVG